LFAELVSIMSGGDLDAFFASGVGKLRVLLSNTIIPHSMRPKIYYILLFIYFIIQVILKVQKENTTIIQK